MLNGKELMLGDYANIADYDLPEAVGVVEEIYAKKITTINNKSDTVYFLTKKK